MHRFHRSIALLLCGLLSQMNVCFGAATGYSVKYSGGSLQDVKGGADLKLFIETDSVRLQHKKVDALSIPATAITELSYGQEVHRRIGTAAGVAVVTLGIGALIAFSKSKKHYIGIVWDDGKGNKGGLALQADKNEFRGLLAALEGVSGKKAMRLSIS
jgi:CxxC motif-containing protein (DUF1111 family)